MPNYKFPTRKESQDLLEELKKLQEENGAELKDNKIFQNYVKEGYNHQIFPSC